MAAVGRPPFDADATAFLLLRLENRTDHELQYCTHEFSTGDMVHFDGSPVGPGQSKYWSCASSRWLQGNVGCAVYSLPKLSTEIMLMWNFAYSGTREDRCGIRIGALGKFSSKDRLSLVCMFDDSAAHSSDIQTVVFGDMVAGCSFGRDPALFFIAPTILSRCRELETEPHPVHYERSVRSFMVCELENQGGHWLRLIRTPFLTGQCRSAVPIIVPSGATVRWSCGQAAHMAAVGRGNVGCAIFSVEGAAAEKDGSQFSNYFNSEDPAPGDLVGIEVMLMWHSPSVGQDRIGCRMGLAGSFSKLDLPALQLHINNGDHMEATVELRRPRQQWALCPGYAARLRRAKRLRLVRLHRVARIRGHEVVRFVALRRSGGRRRGCGLHGVDGGHCRHRGAAPCGFRRRGRLGRRAGLGLGLGLGHLERLP
eukprot:SAG11_NODE_1390_length_5055_cov_2.299637_6_plen_425_part_00